MVEIQYVVSNSNSINNILYRRGTREVRHEPCATSCRKELIFGTMPLEQPLREDAADVCSEQQAPTAAVSRHGG